MNDRQLLRAFLFAVLALAFIGAGIAVASTGGTSRPSIRIVKAPPRRTTANEAVFRFKAEGLRTSCRRDGRRFRRCHTSVKYTGLRPGATRSPCAR